MDQPSSILRLRLLAFIGKSKNIDPASRMNGPLWRVRSGSIFLHRAVGADAHQLMKFEHYTGYQAATAAFVHVAKSFSSLATPPGGSSPLPTATNRRGYLTTDTRPQARSALPATN